MPEAPFTADDIIIEFAPKNKMSERAIALCALYVPDKIYNENQIWELDNTIGGNALIGRDKSAILVRFNSKTTPEKLRSLIYHELTHIFCTKTEIDGKHFIDIYGSGNTFAENPEDVAYDGFLNAGYVVWSEFIAQYYALKYVHKDKFSVSELSSALFNLLNEVNHTNNAESKTSFAMVCSYLFLCNDVESFIDLLDEPGFLFDEQRYSATQARIEFKRCLLLLSGNLQKTKPWKISEDFIARLGSAYALFVSLNSVYLGTFDRTEFETG